MKTVLCFEGQELELKPRSDPDTCRYCGKGLTDDAQDEVCDDCAKREKLGDWRIAG